MLAGEQLPESGALAAVLKYCRHYRRGFLPAAGGIGEQNPYLMECIEAVDSACAEHERLEAASPRMGPGDSAARATARFDGPLPGRPGFRPGWRAHRKPIE